MTSGCSARHCREMGYSKGRGVSRGWSLFGWLVGVLAMWAAGYFMAVWLPLPASVGLFSLGVASSVVATLGLQAVQHGGALYTWRVYRRHRAALRLGAFSQLPVTIIHSRRDFFDNPYVHLGDAQATMMLMGFLGRISDRKSDFFDSAASSTTANRHGPLILVGGPVHNAAVGKYCRRNADVWRLDNIEVSRSADSRSTEIKFHDGHPLTAAKWDSERKIDCAVVAIADDASGRRVVFLFGLRQYGTIAAAYWFVHVFATRGEQFCRDMERGGYVALKVDYSSGAEVHQWDIQIAGDPQAFSLKANLSAVATTS